MAFFPFKRQPRKKSSRETPVAKSDDARSQLALQLDAIKQQRQELHRMTQAAQQKVEDIPKLIAKRKLREKELIRERARKSKTLQLGRPTYRIPSVVTSAKMTRAQQRMMVTKLLILCAVLAVFLMILWRTVR